MLADVMLVSWTLESLVVERKFVRHSSDGTRSCSCPMESAALALVARPLATIVDPAGNVLGVYQEPRR